MNSSMNHQKSTLVKVEYEIVALLIHVFKKKIKKGTERFLSLQTMIRYLEANEP